MEDRRALVEQRQMLSMCQEFLKALILGIHYVVSKTHIFYTRDFLTTQRDEVIFPQPSCSAQPGRTISKSSITNMTMIFFHIPKLG